MRGVGRCLGCHVERRHAEAAVSAPCGSDWGREMLAGHRERGHRISVAFVERRRELPSPLLICLQCGSWAEAGTAKGLLGQCSGQPSRHAADAIRRVRRGLCPKAGKAAREGVVSDLIPALA